MNRLFQIVSFLLLCIAVYADEINGVCIKVSDGDTIMVDLGEEIIKVRLQGIDAPESNQEHGLESTRYLEGRILNKAIRVDRVGVDRYSRTLGIIYLDSENINLAMVREGMAWDYKEYNAGIEYTRAEQEARKMRKGLWKAERPIAPWYYRHPERLRAKKGAAGAEQPDRNTPSGAPQAHGKYWVSKGGVVHNETCRYYRNCPGAPSDAPKGRDCGICGGVRR